MKKKTVSEMEGYLINNISSTTSILLVFVFCCCCILIGYYLSILSRRCSEIAELKQSSSENLSTGLEQSSTPCTFPKLNDEKEEQNSGSSSSIINVLSNRSELALTSSFVTSDSSCCGSHSGAQSPNLPLSPSSSEDDSNHVSSDYPIKERGYENHDSELFILHLKNELSGMKIELSQSKGIISNLQMEISLLNDSKETMERNIMELNDAVNAKEMYIDLMHQNIEKLIHELTDDQPLDKRKNYTLKANLRDTCVEPDEACNDAYQTGEFELFGKLRSIALQDRHSITLTEYDTIHTREVEILQEDLLSAQGSSNYLKKKNIELQMQLTMKSEKLHHMKLAQQSEKYKFNTFVQEMQEKLHSRETEIAMLKSTANSLNEELVSLRHRLTVSEERFTCIAEERSLLQQQLADALQSLESEKAVAATKLQESFDALSRKEEEVKLVTKEFGLIQSELFSVMEQLQFEMKDMQHNVSSLREIVSEKDCIIQELQKHKRIHCRCASVLPYPKGDFNTVSWEEVESFREHAEFEAILLGSEILPLFDSPQSSSTSENHISQGDEGSVPTYPSSKRDPATQSNFSEMLNHPSLDTKNNDAEAATTDDESETHADVADFLFGRGTASLLRTSKKNQQLRR